MDRQLALRHPSRLTRWPDRFRRGLCLAGFAGLVAASLYLSLPSAGGVEPGTTIQQLVRWQDAGHDWLLVVDPTTRELVVYDAVDGRPLERLGVADGLPEVESIALRGSGLFVKGSRPAAVRLLSLPALQAVAANVD